MACNLSTPCSGSGSGAGTNVLDLSQAGDTCKDRRFCQLTCLVCGGPVVHGEDGRDFELFRDVVNGDAAGDGRRMHSILQRRQATMVENWDTPVHKACAIASSRCECVLARESVFCPTHEQAKYALCPTHEQAQYKMDDKEMEALVGWRSSGVGSGSRGLWGGALLNT